MTVVAECPVHGALLAPSVEVLGTTAICRLNGCYRDVKVIREVRQSDLRALAPHVVGQRGVNGLERRKEA